MQSLYRSKCFNKRNCDLVCLIQSDVSVSINKFNNGKWMYIGESIYTFTPLSDIIEYFSPIGNSDVPYPYAIDTDGRYYLMIKNVILAPNQNKERFDPYNYYYFSSRDEKMLSKEFDKEILLKRL